MRNNKFIGCFYLVFILIITYIPIMLTTFYSFNESELSIKWTGFSLKWYYTLIKDHDIIKASINSLILAILSSILSAIVALTASLYGRKNKGRIFSIFEGISNLPIMIPEIILGMVFLSTFILYHLPFGMVTLVLSHMTFCIPYIYMQITAKLKDIDDNLIDAAMDLGASRLKAFFDITLYLLMPAIFSGMLLSFAMSFDDVIISIFVTGPKTSLLPLRIYTRMKTGITPEINALNTVMLAIIILALLINYIIKKLNERKIKKYE